VLAVLKRALGDDNTTSSNKAAEMEDENDDSKLAAATTIKLLRIGAIRSLPECDPQPMHRDGQHLFQREVKQYLPPHALHLWIPLTTYTKQTGATIFAAGTHRIIGDWDLIKKKIGIMPSGIKCQQPEVDLGSAIIFDDRIFHQGHHYHFYR